MGGPVDEVIQSDQSLLAAEQRHPSHGMNKSAPLMPVPLSPQSMRKLHSSSRMRPNSQVIHEEPHTGYSNGRGDRDTPSRGRRSVRQSDDGSASSRSEDNTIVNVSGHGSNMADFFSSEIFNLVIHNPITAHRFLRFCQSRACGENMEFLQKVDKYHRLLDEVTQTLGAIHATYTSADAPRQINITHTVTKRLSTDIKQTTQQIIPSLEALFLPASEHVERLLSSDVYPRFVKHQVTTSAVLALSDQRERYQGLGDCFCLTDPGVADNPIAYASDGFISVTGYTRKDIIPRNCRFLQGELTDPLSTKRLRASIDACEETVELLLNYRKNGDPFWNLLYLSPLFNERGEVSFFLGGQINCSTTIHSCTDVLRVLSANDDELDKLDEIALLKSKPASVRSREPPPKQLSTFFKSWRKYDASNSQVKPKVHVREEAGMEGELINRVGKLSFKTQVEAFYTAYSKYLVMSWNSTTQTLLIQHYSPGIIDMLCLNLPNGGAAPIFNQDIFKILSEHSSAAGSAAKAFKNSVREAVRAGKAVSVETGLRTGFEERKGTGWFGVEKEGWKKVEEKYVTHWTPLKDEEGGVKWVVLTIAPKL